MKPLPFILQVGLLYLGLGALCLGAVLALSEWAEVVVLH